MGKLGFYHKIIGFNLSVLAGPEIRYSLEDKLTLKPECSANTEIFLFVGKLYFRLEYI